MKVGFIRCMQTEDMCPGTTDFKMPLRINLQSFSFVHLVNFLRNSNH